MDDVEAIDQNGSMSEEEGNTSVPPRAKKRIASVMKWFFTWNNYDLPQWLAWLDSTKVGPYRDRYVKIVAQQEVGEKGTPHIQGYIEFVKKTRPSEAGFVGLPKQVHWEKVRSEEAAIDYCNKLDTRNGEVFTKNYVIPEPLKVISRTDMYPWQKEVLDIVTGPVRSGEIHWFYEANGGRGKTAMGKYLIVMHGAMITEGKKNDIRHSVAKFHETHGATPKIIVIDCPLGDIDHISYPGLESVKNMCFYSAKYEGSQIVGNEPHVIVFANKEPDYSQMTNRRWDVHKIL